MTSSGDYAQYLANAEANGIDPNSLLSEADFNAIQNITVTNGEAEQIAISIEKSLPELSVGSRLTESVIKSVGLALKTGNIPGDARRNVERILLSAAAARGEQFVKGVADKIGNIGSSSIPGSGSSDGMGGSSYASTNGAGGNVNFNFGMINLNPVPLKFNLTTPIVPSCYPDYFLDSNGITESNLHITGGGLTWNNLSEARLSSFIDTVLCNELRVKLQQENSFRIVTSDLTSAKLLAYLKNITECLNVVYSLTSIFEYCRPENKHTNKGMYDLRASFDPYDIELLYELIRQISTYPIPPRLNEMCWFLNQNYKMSENPGSSLMKFLPFGFAKSRTSKIDLSTVTYTVGIRSLITNLNDNENRRIASTLASAAPNWLNVDIMAPSPTVLYSPNFNTIWANAPGTLSDQRTLTAGSAYADVDYCTYAGRLDGAAYALTSIYDTVSSSYAPTMFMPIESIVTVGTTEINSNRWTYNGTDSSLNLTGSNASLANARGEVSTFDSSQSQFESSTPFGTERRRGVNISTVSQSAIQFAEWLFSIDTISGNNSKSRTRGKRMRNSTDIVNKED